jgi:hypothetical protein
LISKIQQQQIEWRRDRVLELSSQGFNQSDIVTMLQVDKSVISRDLAYLKQEARKNLQHHISETIPAEYHKAVNSLNLILRMSWSIVSKTEDEKTKLQALALINDCNKYRVDLSSGAGIVSEAMKYVTQKAEQVDTLQKLDERIEEAVKGEGEREEETTTTNGVF